ncbi:MAG: efflux RND transporter permease subunit [Rhodospirillales bacterium]|nr:efflux RND transporter permease subunit [Rhodospirillales bacterium]
MKELIRLAIERPVAVIAAVLMVLLFGAVALHTIPIQLVPDVDRPVITIGTNWPGAAPAEVEREIILPQEEVLAGIEGMTRLLARARQNEGEITLEFQVGTDMDKAFLLVSNRLDRVSGYPEEVYEPVLDTASSEDTPIAWFNLIRLPGNERPMYEYADFIDDVVADRLKRVPGVADAVRWGGAEREVRVEVSPGNLSRYGLTVPDVVSALREADSTATAGYVDEGKRRYTVRAEGEFQSLDDIRDVVVLSSEDDDSGRLARVTVGDIADVSFAYKDITTFFRFNGEPAISMRANRESGANVIATMDGIRAAVDELNAFDLPNAGLELVQVYDETVYIEDSIDLVTNNIWVGGLLAAIVLLAFLRSPRATLIISIAIPVSVIGSFVAMAALGRSINVISLAGLAFAVGMVVDAAIVVLENIYRLREQGMPARKAAFEGARQVWGAIMVSALTTVMVFVPILVMQMEAGQVFRDIAVAISVSVILSLLVAVTLIPALCSRLFARIEDRNRLRVPPLDRFAAVISAGLRGFARNVARNRAVAAATIVAIIGTAVAMTIVFLPKLEYLPDGNRNFISGWVSPPSGYNLSIMDEIATRVEDATRPYWKVSHDEEIALHPDGQAIFDRFYFGSGAGWTWIGGAAVDGDLVRELIPIMRDTLADEPGTHSFFRQPSIFGRGLGGNRSVDLDISGPDLGVLAEVASEARGRILEEFGAFEGVQIRNRPSVSSGVPEIRVVPDRLRLADNGITAQDLSMGIDAFNSGLRVKEISLEGREIDLTLTGPDNHIVETQGIGKLPIVNHDGLIIPVSSLADVMVTIGPGEIRRLEQNRTVTLVVNLPPGIPLETGIEMIQVRVIDAMREAGLPQGVQLRLAGTADKLTATWDAMVVNLLIALVIVYLVMAVLFESFLHPLIVMIAVPVAAAGGVLGLLVLNIFQTQPLDMLTMLGFVILIGIVVNNAILLVHQTRHHMREDGMAADAAIGEAVRNRIRPIFMSTLTSVFGMVPLVLFPGAGSELYRGLGSVVVGGLSLSAVLTLTLVPPLLGLVLRLTESLPDIGSAVDAGREPAE